MNVILSEEAETDLDDEGNDADSAEKPDTPVWPGRRAQAAACVLHSGLFIKNRNLSDIFEYETFFLLALGPLSASSDGDCAGDCRVNDGSESNVRDPESDF
jgi:hypothetical protein